jgi:ElaB/YqjD/DUF883 family membrane-anchored ribosome-binding protein
MSTETRLEDLMDASGELLAQVADEKGPEIAALRDRLTKGLKEAKQYLADTAQQAGEQIKDTAVAVDDYVHDSPWISIGIAATVAAALGYAAGMANARPRRRFGIF